MLSTVYVCGLPGWSIVRLSFVAVADIVVVVAVVYTTAYSAAAVCGFAFPLRQNF